jgi:hypothetical protein
VAGAAAAGGAGGAGELQKRDLNDAAAVELHCQVKEQKERLTDEVCGRIVEKGHAGLCE